VKTYVELARMSVEELAEICRAPKMRTPNYANWIEQAQSLSG